ncbi:MAG TPA: hypothetical protein PLT47_02155 [Bacteroidales bacterium]|nr:hypothetical protein [Bacteroidales bacterium]
MPEIDTADFLFVNIGKGGRLIFGGPGGADDYFILQDGAFFKVNCQRKIFVQLNFFGKIGVPYIRDL